MSTIMTVAEEKGAVENYTEDGTVDLKGRPVSRSKTGRWKACSFIVGKMKAFRGLSNNLNHEILSFMNMTYTFMCN